MKTFVPQDNWYVSHKTQIRENVSLSVVDSLLPLGGESFLENGIYPKEAEMRNTERERRSWLYNQSSG